MHIVFLDVSDYSYSIFSQKKIYSPDLNPVKFVTLRIQDHSSVCLWYDKNIT